jgi:hypothetical protein
VSGAGGPVGDVLAGGGAVTGACGVVGRGVDGRGREKGGQRRDGGEEVGEVHRGR